MANHLRTQIRDAAVTLLTGLATTGANVLKTRFYDQEASSLPLLIVYLGDEEAEPVAMFGNRTLDRSVKLIVEAKARAISGVEDTINTICKEVEAAIAGNRKFSGLARNSFLESISAPEPSVDASKPSMMVRIVFDVSYRARDISPDTPAS